MKPPLISCIVPVFNGERYLAEALNSILAQTYRSLEIVVADDGSTDATAALVASYGDRVRYVWQPNAGPAAARNLGISVVQGELVAFLDQDDLWHPEKLERQTARFVPGLNLDACVTHVQPFWIPELRHAASQSRDHRLTRAVPGYLTGTLLARPSLFETGILSPHLTHKRFERTAASCDVSLVAPRPVQLRMAPSLGPA